MKGVADPTMDFSSHRLNRGQQLGLAGLALGQSFPCAKQCKALKPRANVAKVLERMALNLKLDTFNVNSFRISEDSIPKFIYAKAKSVPERAFHLIH